MTTSTVLDAPRFLAYSFPRNDEDVRHHNITIGPRLLAAVRKLAEFRHEDDIADFFRSERIKGQTGKSYSCPVARWIRREVGWHARVAHKISISHGGGVTVIDAPYVVTAFYNKFDNGAYPDLIEPSCACSQCRPW